MDYLNTHKVIRLMPDPRELRIQQIRQELRDPGRLTDQQLQSLSHELYDIEFDLQARPAEEE